MDIHCGTKTPKKAEEYQLTRGSNKSVGLDRTTSYT